VAELADALRSGRSGHTLVWVQIPPSALDSAKAEFFIGIFLVSFSAVMKKYFRNLRIDKTRAIYIGGLVISVFILMTLFGRISELARLTNQRNQVSTEIADLEKTHTYLETQLAYAKSVRAVEDYAREEGHMALPGDKMYVPLPPPGETPQPKLLALPTPEYHPAWQIWWALFFGQ
jgi:cell division protein FtsB